MITHNHHGLTKTQCCPPRPPNFNITTKARAPNHNSQSIQTFYISSAALSNTVLPEGVIVDSCSTTHVFKRPGYFVNWDRNFKASKCVVKLAYGNVTDLIKGRGAVDAEVDQ